MEQWVTEVPASPFAFVSEKVTNLSIFSLELLFLLFCLIQKYSFWGWGVKIEYLQKMTATRATQTFTEWNSRSVSSTRTFPCKDIKPINGNFNFWEVTFSNVHYIPQSWLKSAFIGSCTWNATRVCNKIQVISQKISGTVTVFREDLMCHEHAAGHRKAQIISNISVNFSSLLRDIASAVKITVSLSRASTAKRRFEMCEWNASVITWVVLFTC